MNVLAIYREYLREIKWPFSAGLWLIISFIVALLISAIIWLIIGVIQIFPMKPVHAILFTFIVFIAILDILASYPYLLSLRRISSIEENLPDAFKQMADTLKAGGTFEYALRTVSSAEYGPLTEEITLVLRRLEEGENLRNSLLSFSRNINSRIVKRAVNIILDSLSAGASLASILDEIADDLRSVHRIIRERKSTTLMQVLFIVSAGIIVSPFIFGLVSALIEFLMEQTLSAISVMGEVGTKLPESSLFCDINSFITPEGTNILGYWYCVSDTIIMLLVVYIIIESIAVGAMVSMIREGNLSKSFIYIPIFLFIAYVCYYGSYVLIKSYLA